MVKIWPILSFEHVKYECNLGVISYIEIDREVELARIDEKKLWKAKIALNLIYNFDLQLEILGFSKISIVKIKWMFKYWNVYF